MIGRISISVFLVALASQRSFVNTAPTPDTGRANAEVKGDVNVKELENLKSSLGRTLSLMRTQTGIYSDINGNKQAHSLDTEEVKQNGNMVAKITEQIDSDPSGPDKGGQPRAVVRTEMDLPPEGIRESTKQKLPLDYPGLTENGNRKSLNVDLSQESRNNVERTNSITSEPRHTPLDMAEYIFWTGDEKSVSQAIEEYLQEELMTKEEAIMFLQEIKYNLEYLKSHYSRYGPNSGEQPSTSVKGKQEPQENYQLNREPEVTREKTAAEQIRSELNQLRQFQETFKKRNVERNSAAVYFTGSNREKSLGVNGEKTVTEEEYQDLLERLRLADFLYTEYSLEEVIYQLAKVMFTQSLSGGGADAQQALTRFMNFLEKEAEQGHISRALEKKVLDVLIASLSDTVSEHPELLDLRQGQPSPSTNENVAGRQFLKQLLELSAEDKAFLQKILNSSYNNGHKEPSGRGGKLSNDNFQTRDQKIEQRIPFGFGK